MINWVDFKDDQPKIDGESNDPSILIAEPATSMGIPTFNVYVSGWRSGNGCYTSEYGHYVKPKDGVFWALLNNPYPTII